MIVELCCREVWEFERVFRVAQLDVKDIVESRLAWESDTCSV